MKYILILLLQMSVFNGIGQVNLLKITVPNINKIEGSLVVAIYNNEGTFIKPGKEYKKMTRKITASVETILFANLPPGEYGVAIYHDRNDDGKCNTNFLGIPKEGYGFSRNFRPRFSAPVFNDTKIKLTADEDLEIRMVY